MSDVATSGLTPSHQATQATALQVEGQQGPSVGRTGDLAIARAAAEAVRAVPGVVELSPGLTTPAATYGTGPRVTGVVVHHLAPEQVVLEIHVVLSEAHCTGAAAATRATDERASHGANGPGVLAEVAGQIRSAASDAVRQAGLLEPMRVDVLVDDLR